MALGYDGKLYILAFDHRGSFQKKWFGIEGEPSPEETETITDAKSRGKDVWTEDTLKSMDVSNSTTALGIAVALGEIYMPTAEQIHKDLSLFSSVASCSSGVALFSVPPCVARNVSPIFRPVSLGISLPMTPSNLRG